MALLLLLLLLTAMSVPEIDEVGAATQSGMMTLREDQGGGQSGNLG